MKTLPLMPYSNSILEHFVELAREWKRKNPPLIGVPRIREETMKLEQYPLYGY